MTRDLRDAPRGATVARGRPCPGGNADHVILDPTDDELRQVGLPPKQQLHVDRARQPSSGDLAWIELVRHGSTQRLLRRYALDGGWVTLSTPGSSSAAIMRRRAELLVLGVVDETPRCAAVTS